jgi:hypothetical protein
MTYAGTITLPDPLLLDTMTDLPDGFTGYVRIDTDSESPREWDTLTTLVQENRRRGEIDRDEYLDTARDHWRWTQYDSLVGAHRSDRAVKAVGYEGMIRRYISIFRPDIKLYVDRWDAGRDLYGWGYITTEAWDKAEFGVEVDPQDVFDSEVSTYQQWADGEVYGVTVVNEETGEEASLWGCYDDGRDYLREVALDLIFEVSA